MFYRGKELVVDKSRLRILLWNNAMLVVFYIIYTIYLYVQESKHKSTRTFHEPIWRFLLFNQKMYLTSVNKNTILKYISAIVIKKILHTKLSELGKFKVNKIIYYRFQENIIWFYDNKCN